MLRTFLLVLSVSSTFALGLAACSTTHASPIAAGTYEVQFHTGPAAIVPLKESEVWREGGYDILFESAVVQYAQGTFVDRQGIFTLRGAHDETMELGEDVYRSTLASVASQLVARAASQQIEARCEDPTRSNDAPANVTGWSLECRYTHEAVTQNVAVRMLANTKILFFQVGSWSTDWGREKTFAFFRSLHPAVDAKDAKDTKPSAGKSVALSVATLQRGFAKALH